MGRNVATQYSSRCPRTQMLSRFNFFVKSTHKEDGTEKPLGPLYHGSHPNVAAAIANVVRSDLVPAGVAPNAEHGFELSLPRRPSGIKGVEMAGVLRVRGLPRRLLRGAFHDGAADR